MFLQRLLSWLQGGSLTLIGWVFLIILVWGTLAPVGTLTWWLQLETERLKLGKNQPPEGLLPGPDLEANAGPSTAETCYIVFLPGVGDIDGNLSPGEAVVLQRLVATHPSCIPVDGVFPYSAANQALGVERPLSPLWKFVETADGWLGTASLLVDIRNLWRMAISADDRYGPIYNRGIAIAIVEQMQAQQPLRDRQEPLNLVLIGTSGGAQIALAATPYLDQWLNADIVVISIGGFFRGTDGFAQAEQVYHLQGRRDWTEDIASVIFPSHWPWVVGSPLNRARRQGRFTVVTTGPHKHYGPKGYFDQALIPSREQTYVDLTVQTIQQLPVWSGLAERSQP